MEETFLKLAASFGASGVMLAGVIFFIGKRLLRLEEAFDRHTKMELMRLIVSPHVAPDVKNALENQLRDVELAEKRRRRKNDDLIGG